MDERTALQRAVVLAMQAGRTSPNPKVGCVILDLAGSVVGEGFHRGAGHPHAEIEAIRAAGAASRGGTAIVTLEPCAHTGLTGPCTSALLEAGVARVVVGRRDPNPLAAGGVEVLRAAGIDVVVADPLPEVQALNRYWEFAMRNSRPAVVWKVAATLDGMVAAADGTSRWITGPQARQEVHELRSQLDAVMVGTGTALADDPRLTIRGQGPARQPLRVVVGKRELPPALRIFDSEAPSMVIQQRDPAIVLQRLWDRGVRSVMLEGGPTVSAAFLAADLIDFIVWFSAPRFLGAGRSALGDIGAGTLGQARGFVSDTVRLVGGDIRIDLTREEA